MFERIFCPWIFSQVGSNFTFLDTLWEKVHPLRYVIRKYTIRLNLSKERNENIRHLRAPTWNTPFFAFSTGATAPRKKTFMDLAILVPRPRALTLFNQRDVEGLTDAWVSLLKRLDSWIESRFKQKMQSNEKKRRCSWSSASLIYVQVNENGCGQLAIPG